MSPVEELWDMVKTVPAPPVVGHALVQLVLMVEQLEAKIVELEGES